MSVPKAVEPAAAISASSVMADTPEAHRFLARKRRVVTLGGGLSGLTTAYMLSRINTRYNIEAIVSSSTSSRHSA